MTKTDKTIWWKDGVIYQIYPRSFYDSNGDGIGDLRGVTQKMDYIASLNVDAIWLSPFFTSPMKDFGYDVSDYRGIDPIFGTMDDFDALVEAAHKRDIKVLIDQVWPHVSDQHPWFIESRSSRDNDKADWFIWAESKEDGTPPNNWLSYFGGSAWEWDTRRCQYYLHHFLASQPNLNLWNPDVQNALKDVARFWLDKGVDGFRMDSVQSFLCDQDLRDNPPRGPNDPVARKTSRPMSKQVTKHSHLIDETIVWIKQIRSVLDEYDDRALLAEVGGDKALVKACRFVEGQDKFHFAYTFDLLGDVFTPQKIKQAIETVEAHIKDGWICWAISNHDVPRVASRWGKEHAHNPDFVKLCLALGLSLRGSYCLYQGEELGLTEADIAFEQMQDPAGIRFYPDIPTRDGCRTPMPWKKKGTHAGFNDAGTPWLPIPDNHLSLAVDQQEANKKSPLAFTREFLVWRKEQPALLYGDIHVCRADERLLVFNRSYQGNTITCVFNFSAEPVSCNDIRQDDTPLTLPAFGFAHLF